jgi:hypothetical protein
MSVSDYDFFALSSALSQAWPDLKDSCKAAFFKKAFAHIS